VGARARDCARNAPLPLYDGGKVEGGDFKPLAGRSCRAANTCGVGADGARVPEHCSFCSVWKTDGQRPRQRRVDAVVEEIVTLRRIGFRFVALADDNFYP